jgi:hypothetical protein
MNLASLIALLIKNGDFLLIAMNAVAQFGVPGRRYQFAELMPERLVKKNLYRETGIRFRTIVANDGTRYSPVQKKDGKLVSSVLVELGESDIGDDITAEDYDTLLDMIGEASGLDPASDFVRNWADAVLNLALVEHNERQRVGAIVAGQIVRKGDGGYLETINYPNFSGQRANASVQWSDPNNDPFDADILPRVQLLRDKGFVINRIKTSSTVQTILQRNPKVRNAVLGRSDGAGMISIALLNEYMRSNNLPPLETYDLTYQLQNDVTSWFYPRNGMTFFCTTGRDQTVDTGTEQIALADTFGYVGVGRAAGQSAPGRKILVQHKEDKPPRIDGQGWQTSAPVVQEPDATSTIGAIS